MNVGLEHYLTVSAMLFCLGLLGVILRRNVLVIYMSLELMLNAANLTFVTYSRILNDVSGQTAVFFVLVVAVVPVDVVALVFVLMADYAVRRLAFVHASDADARAALAGELDSMLTIGFQPIGPCAAGECIVTAQRLDVLHFEPAARHGIDDDGQMRQLPPRETRSGR